MKKIWNTVVAWVFVRWNLLRYANNVIAADEYKDKRIALLLQQIDARDKGINRAARRIDELETARDEAIDSAISANLLYDETRKNFDKAVEELTQQRREVDRLRAVLTNIEEKSGKEYVALPTTNGKRTRKKPTPPEA